MGLPINGAEYIAVLSTAVNYLTVNIGPCNGLVPSGNKPSPEPVLTKISNVLWRQ